MIEHSAYGVDPWALHEYELDLSLLAQSESIFALSNGHIGLRGNLDEGDPHGLPGTYLNSVCELRPMVHGEIGFGYPSVCETVINVTNGKLIRLFVDDEPFDVRYGILHRHERVLDFQAGTLSRIVEWTSPAGKSVRVTSVRLVSLTQRAVAAIRYDVEAIDGPLRVVVQSALVTNEALPASRDDPRVAAALAAPLVNEEHANDDLRFVTVHRTKVSELLVGAGMSHVVDGPPETLTDGESFPDVCRLTIAAKLDAGQQLRVDKTLAYGWSSQRSRSAVHDQVVAAMVGAALSGWDGLVAEQRDRLDQFWAGADVEVDGDAEVQQAVRFALFSVFQASARAEQRPIAAKGLTGPGYEGHTFWDTETFVLPVLMFTAPDAAADELRWRQHILPHALENARKLGLSGAAFPWRTIRGREGSGYWPAGTAAFHVNADIADAAIRYVDVTGDADFERDVALPLVVATPRLWRSLGHHDADGRFRIDGVTGPDEYDAVVDNNVYTNLMAAQNLRVAAELANRYPDECESLNANREEAASWRHAADTMLIPHDERLGVHPQSELYLEHERWDFRATEPDQYPLLLHFPYFQLYRKQVVKQADLVLAMYLHHEAFTPEEKQRNFAYYEQLTVRDSSLSAGPQAVIAAEVGQLELAYDYIAETALVDLRDLNNNTEDGLHLASLASTWTALVAGLGGMRAGNGKLSFAPRLPQDLVGFAFRVCYRGSRISVRVEPEKATYELLLGDPVTVYHHGEPITLDGPAISVPIPALPPPGPRPRQPHGREPITRDTVHHHPVVEQHDI